MRKALPSYRLKSAVSRIRHHALCLFLLAVLFMLSACLYVPLWSWLEWQWLQTSRRRPARHGADKVLNGDVWLGIKTENSVCLTLSEWLCPAQKRVLTRKYVKNDAFYNLLLISELVASVALIVSPLCLKGMLLRCKSIPFASRKGTFCSVKPLNFSRKNGGLGLYKLCRCDEMLNIGSRNASDVNFCLCFVFQIKENSCPDFLLSHRP